jgi:splicing factor 3B subunit 3
LFVFSFFGASTNWSRIFSFEDLTDNTTYESIALKYTPRKMVSFPEQGTFYVIQSEINTLTADTRKQLIAKGSVKQEDNNNALMEIEGTNGETANGHVVEEEFPASDFGYPHAQGSWASCIQVVDPITSKSVTHSVEINANQSLISAAFLYFESRGDEPFLAVGTAKDLSFQPYKYSSASIRVYKVSPDGRELEFFHETEVSEPPTAMLAFKGKLVVGVGRNLCLYDCGMKSMLRKAQASNCVPTRITDLKTQGSRLVVSDSVQSVIYVVHKDQVHPNKLIPFVDDIIPRHTTCVEMLDYDTTAGGDKFGNIWLVRCPQKASEGSDESADGSDLLVDKSYLGGTANRLDTMAHFYTNDIPVSIQKTVLLSGGERVIFWAGLQGTLGALIPFSSRRQHKMFQQLELQLRSDDKPLSGRDHLAYRSTFNPVKLVLDGDLIERFLVLSRDKRGSIAAQITGAEWTPEMIDEAIWNMRGLYAF